MDAFYVSLEVELGVFVVDGHHLREVNDKDLLGVVDHEIELVEVTVNQTMLCELHQKVQTLVEGGLGVLHVVDLTHSIGVDIAHENGVSIHVNRLRGGEAVLMEDLHVAELFIGSDPTEVQPTVLSPSVEVVSVVLDCSEGGSAQSGHFEDEVFPIWALAQENIWKIVNKHTWRGRGNAYLIPCLLLPST